MREIKYRTWDKDIEMMRGWNEIICEKYEGDKYYLLGYKLNKAITKYDHEQILMQYTGLKDKEGTEIYEGDIVKYTFDSPNSLYATENGLKARISKVFWSDWRGSFAVGNSLANSDLFNYVRNGNRVEVAGNIYENPELLEVEE